MNKVILIGNIGKEPKSGTTNSGKEYCRFSVATREYNNETEWHSVTCWGKTAEIASKYTNKGSKVAIEGRLQTREFTNADGQQVRATSIVADRLELLGSKSSAQQNSGGQQKEDAGWD